MPILALVHEHDPDSAPESCPENLSGNPIDLPIFPRGLCICDISKISGVWAYNPNREKTERYRSSGRPLFFLTPARRKMKKIVSLLMFTPLAALCTGCSSGFWMCRSLYSDELWNHGPTSVYNEEKASVSITNDGRLIVSGKEHYYVFNEFKPYKQYDGVQDFMFLRAIPGNKHIDAKFYVYIKKETQAITTVDDTGYSHADISISLESFPDETMKLLNHEGFSISGHWKPGSWMRNYNAVMTGTRYPESDFKVPNSTVLFSPDTVSLTGYENLEKRVYASNFGSIIAKRVALTPFAVVGDIVTYPFQAILEIAAGAAHMHQ